MPLNLLFLALLVPPARGEAPEIADGVRESQVTLSLDRQGKRTRLQGTVIGREGRAFSILTAGHGMGPEEVGTSMRIRQGDGESPARIVKVDRNPYYRPGAGDIPGADNAVAIVRLEEGGTLDPDALRPAEVTAWAVPDRDAQVVTVQVVDQFGKGHVLKAGNFSNPRWLEWGPSYRPIAGDSGSGVFVLRKQKDGTVAPFLIGVVTNRGPRGGGASLVHKQAAAARR